MNFERGAKGYQLRTRTTKTPNTASITVRRTSVPGVNQSLFEVIRPARIFITLVQSLKEKPLHALLRRNLTGTTFDAEGQIYLPA